ncbi:MAG: antibiotic biosynthesis monooxygenase [Erysipelotrichaceae bacterium]|nr:antibiotic biosynthesis monooxygenase [Erysipelotrichaceae bacterium]
MSVIFNLSYTGKDGSAKKFAEEMVQTGLVDYIRSEPGNERYAYFQSLDDPETILLIDQWKDQDALDAHHADPVMSKIAALRDKYDLHMKAERLYPSEGMLDKDQAFIRS